MIPWLKGAKDLDWIGHECFERIDKPAKLDKLALVVVENLRQKHWHDKKC